jgi:drug/metabolite transporter (DMT)-like permease
LSLLIRKSWIVFIYAIALSAESIIIEYLTSSFIQISPTMLSAISITSAGIMLLMVAAFISKKKKEILLLFNKSWKNLILASLSLSLGIFTWYDSIKRIGASKEVLIAGPLEIVIIVMLARVFLNERLNRFHIIGISMALTGFFMAVASDANIGVGDNIVGTIKTTSLLSIISFGDIEAILSAFGFAIGVLFLSKLVLKHSSIEVAGASMFTSGLMLFGFMILGVLSYESNHIILSSNEVSLLRQPIIIAIIILFSLLPFIGSLSYSTGLSMIGASLTATIGSSSILLTVVIQIVLKEFGISSHLPENIFLAILGGVTGFLGIYIIHMYDYPT